MKIIEKRTAVALSCLFLLVSCFMASCSQDDGNYDYLPDEQVSKITISVDSTLTPNIYQFQTLMPGSEVDIHMKVNYAYADRLQYRWFYLKTYYSTYRAEQVGNDMVYPPADTIAYEKDLKWTCNLQPGTYQLYCQATDPADGM